MHIKFRFPVSLKSLEALATLGFFSFQHGKSLDMNVTWTLRSATSHAKDTSSLTGIWVCDLRVTHFHSYKHILCIQCAWHCSRTYLHKFSYFSQHCHFHRADAEMEVWKVKRELHSWPSGRARFDPGYVSGSVVTRSIIITYFKRLILSSLTSV